MRWGSSWMCSWEPIGTATLRRWRGSTSIVTSAASSSLDFARMSFSSLRYKFIYYFFLFKSVEDCFYGRFTARNWYEVGVTKWFLVSYKWIQEYREVIMYLSFEIFMNLIFNFMSSTWRSIVVVWYIGPIHFYVMYSIIRFLCRKWTRDHAPRCIPCSWGKSILFLSCCYFSFFFFWWSLISPVMP